jgi:exodeoxyribonuclease V alpha subunit
MDLMTGNKNQDLDKALTPIDIHFGRALCRIAEKRESWLYSAAVCASSAIQKGHICIDLQSIVEINPPAQETSSRATPFPRPEELSELLKGTSVVGGPGDFLPLILDGDRLYLQRYWHYERLLAESIRDRAEALEAVNAPDRVSQILKRLFPADESEAVDWQCRAAIVALIKKLIIITGGPGTGKTTTVAKIVSLLLETSDLRPDRIALAAPTGKAAARLKQAFTKAFLSLDTLPEVKKRAGNGVEALTIHRLLGAIAHSPFFKYNAKNPLPYDVVIVDEASMVDCALMAKLLSAIPRESKVILLGDKDQLASVEAGAIFSDICEGSESRFPRREFMNAVGAVAPWFDSLPSMTIDADSDVSPLADGIVELKRNYRFPEGSGIGKVSRAIKQGNAAEALKILTADPGRDFSWQPVPGPGRLAQALSPIVIDRYSRYLGEKNPAKALALFDSFRILCAVRQGPYGVAAINAAIELILGMAGRIAPGAQWYPGRPVMVLGNDYAQGLFNGDVGIAMEDPETNGELRVFFQAEGGKVKSLLPQRLPEHETVFAMTVHKAQGSEFERMLLLLPSEFVPLLSRELLYTGITRAQKKCDLWASADVLQKSIGNRIRRMSGLRDKLWRN